MSSLSRRKILYVITKSNWGGAQAYVFALAKAAQAAGAEVAVALGGTGEPGAPVGRLADRLSEAGVRIIPVRAFSRDFSIRRELAAYAELRRLFRTERPHVVHLNSSKAGGLGALAARISGVPVILFTAHGWDHRSRENRFVRSFVWMASWATIALATKVIAVSQYDRLDAPVVFSRRKLVTIRNGAAPHRFDSRETARESLASHATGAVSIPFWYLSIAELHYNKGLDLLIRAFASQPEDTALVLIGAGEEEGRLRALARTLDLSSRVFFTGFLPDAARYLPAADVFVLPSRKEGLPFTILEAGLAACAVVAAATGGIPEAITDEETGLLFPRGSGPALATALRTLYADPSARARLGAALKEKIERDFSETRMVRETLALYE